MRVLVAGGAGFIGSHTCRELLRRGHDVICLDNLLTGHRENVHDLAGRPGFAFHRGDISDTPNLDVELIIHLASPASPIHYFRHSLETMLANSLGTKRLLDLARHAGARFIFASTSEVYGDPLEHPQPESYFGNVNPIGPRSCYDESKRFGEALTVDYARNRGVDATIVRFFNTYGPQMNLDDGRVVPAMVGAALRGEPLPVHGDGSQTRSFCFVSDLVTGLLHVAFDDQSPYEVYNIGNPDEWTMLELAKELARITGVTERIAFLPAREEDPRQRCPDITRMKERYGWRPHVSLATGMAATVEYYRAVLAQRTEVEPAG